MVGNRQPMLEHRGCFATLGYRMVRRSALRFAVSASQEREPRCVGRYATPDIGHLVARAAKPAAVPLVKAPSVWPVPASAQLLSFTSIKNSRNQTAFGNTSPRRSLLHGTTTAGVWTMSDGRSAVPRADRVKFIVLIATFMAASLLMALHLPA